ncbi:MAG TPA: Uma2 family endonuclease, partial [Bacteroidetes bacterium]|nr:Uma2 family endonuclease [Bacteroidota bacterium]
LSNSTAKYDRGIKKDLYEKFQVKEYWIADPVNASVEVYEIVEGRYKLVGYAAAEGTITSSVLEGLELEMKALFA